jgi:hypothetical protein
MKVQPPISAVARRSLPGYRALSCLAIFLFSSLALRGDSRASFLPQLQRGQVLLYEVHGRLDRNVKTESGVSSSRGPQQLKGDLASHIRLTIQDVHTAKPQPYISAQVELQPGEGTPQPAPGTPAPKITFDILSRGQLGRVHGLDDVSSEQRLLWQFWVARFAFGWTLPPAGMKLGEKWKYDDPELDNSLIAELVWEREITYARNDACPIFPVETCAVFLTQSTLKQKSSTKDSTPQDFRLHELKTLGTARGDNQVIVYVSLKTGLVLRANEDVLQSMDVIVLKTDGTNGVHYTIDASSHLETLFIPQSAPAPPVSAPPTSH